MKVKIGRYPSRLICNVHTNYMRNHYGFNYPPKKDWTRFEKNLEKFEDGVQWAYNGLNRLVFDRLQQTVKVRIDPHDTWSMDSTLAPIILPMLLQLKATKHGAPHIDVNDVPESLRPTEEQIAMYNQDGSTDENFFKRWDYILDCMIWSFENLVNDEWEHNFYHGKSDVKFLPIDKDHNPCEDDEAAFWQMERTDKDTFEVDYEGLKEYTARINKGLLYFGKYFRNLWD